MDLCLPETSGKDKSFLESLVRGRGHGICSHPPGCGQALTLAAECSGFSLLCLALINLVLGKMPNCVCIRLQLY